MRLSSKWLPLVLIGLGGLLLFVYRGQQQPAPATQTSVAQVQATATIRPTNTPLPFFPTMTPTPSATSTAVPLTVTVASVTQTPTAVPTMTATPEPTPLATTVPVDVSGQAWRFGVNSSKSHIQPAVAAGLPVAVWLNWQIDANVAAIPGGTFLQMVRVSQEGLVQSWDALATAVAANPGATWIVGNEPDVWVQDNTTAERYAEIYHEVYTFIKERDATAQLAIASVAQPTPLRLRYLDNVLDAYQQTYGQPMPIDVWTIHAFIFHEELNEWGVSIPPGMDDFDRTTYTIEDHGSLAIFQENLVRFREWMAARGYRERPLIITEFGIVMPDEYGFPPERVQAFMRDAFDFLLTARDAATGYPADDNRLVQQWLWFIVYENEFGLRTGNLYDPATDQLTPLGQTFADYVNR